ncbi:MAG: ParB N-terminal domain-containing protein [Victivallaceae bacterium]|jgi:hypothetical protein
MKTEDHITTASPMLSNPPAEPGPAQSIFLLKPVEDVNIHELADAFPLPEGKEFEQLKRSIEAEGQQIPVIMYKGKLLDGRSRWRACRKLGIAVKAVEWNGTGNLEDLIISLNLHRRYMTASQRAALAVKLLPALEQQAAERRGARNDIREKIPLCGKAVDLAGAKVGVSGKYVIKAEKIFITSIDIYMKLLNGKLSLSQALKETESGEPPSQSQSPREALLEALRQVIKLVPDDLKGRLSEIVKECPTLKKALESSAEDESGDAK